jgi:hypothetical protein
VFSYLVIVGQIKRVELREDASNNGTAANPAGDAKLVETRR